MEVVIGVADDLAVLAAETIEAQLRRRPESVLGLATGSSPLKVYEELIRRHRETGLSFSRARGFLLDEYVGLPAEHPQRYRRVIAEKLVDHLDWPADQVVGPDGLAESLPRACTEYEEAIAEAGGVDIQLLGIGSDGHIAFNEPMSSLTSRTRVKSLTRQTRQDNARFFGGNPALVPGHCLTQGLGTITEARHLILLATGSEKTEAVHQLVEGPVSARWPATIMQHHPHVTVLVDEGAASHLEFADYYRQTYASKPAWQGL
ncbi:glucosamine-6-phosphate deaminase [Nesterenkonia aerolata]|uniref:Glucosamine-6-phosphate deaminase n=1 Tax=Nesterenkonia aerolata TaxID=3074079 RepID=A0ABU2DR44_9MICC|nr:glucosamine-6-phosphate deaminase [Nesterenkonia sp. LY-0111]MDR8018980.1 glucosamine-6-phosphate deaminase [Nesterenkonia sp. LY-0111]